MQFPGETWTPRKGDIVRPIGYIDLGCIPTDVPDRIEQVVADRLVRRSAEWRTTFVRERTRSDASLKPAPCAGIPGSTGHNLPPIALRWTDHDELAQPLAAD